jgi:hypothetical protein
MIYIPFRGNKLLIIKKQNIGSIMSLSINRDYLGSLEIWISSIEETQPPEKIKKMTEVFEKYLVAEFTNKEHAIHQLVVLKDILKKQIDDSLEPSLSEIIDEIAQKLLSDAPFISKQTEELVEDTPKEAPSKGENFSPQNAPSQLLSMIEGLRHACYDSLEKSELFSELIRMTKVLNDLHTVTPFAVDGELHKLQIESTALYLDKLIALYKKRKEVLDSVDTKNSCESSIKENT